MKNQFSSQLEPMALLISNRLNQLNDIYGKAEVYSCINFRNDNPILTRHIENLFMTYTGRNITPIYEAIYASLIRKSA